MEGIGITLQLLAYTCKGKLCNSQRAFTSQAFMGPLKQHSYFFCKLYYAY